MMTPLRSIKLKEIKDLVNLPDGVEYLVTTEDTLNYPGRFCSLWTRKIAEAHVFYLKAEELKEVVLAKRL